MGSNMIEHWLPQGHEIFVIDNFATGKREVVPSVSGLTVCEGSVGDAAMVQTCLDRFRPEVVIHAAASYKDPDNWRGCLNQCGRKRKCCEGCGILRS